VRARKQKEKDVVERRSRVLGEACKTESELYSSDGEEVKWLLLPLAKQQNAAPPPPSSLTTTNAVTPTITRMTTPTRNQHV
jgi:hypothetical protein